MTVGVVGETRVLRKRRGGRSRYLLLQRSATQSPETAGADTAGASSQVPSYLYPPPGQFVLPMLVRLAGFSLNLTSISGQGSQLLLFFFFFFELKPKQTLFSRVVSVEALSRNTPAAFSR